MNVDKILTRINQSLWAMVAIVMLFLIRVEINYSSEDFHHKINYNGLLLVVVYNSNSAKAKISREPLKWISYEKSDNSTY